MPQDNILRNNKEENEPIKKEDEVSLLNILRGSVSKKLYHIEDYLNNNFIPNKTLIAQIFLNPFLEMEVMENGNHNAMNDRDTCLRKE